MTPPSAAPTSSGPAVASNVRDTPIDMQKLAEKVYRLLMDDLRVQQTRAWGGRKGHF